MNEDNSSIVSPVLYFTLTDVEQRMLSVLASYGEALIGGIVDARKDGPLPDDLSKAIDSYGETSAMWGGQYPEHVSLMHKESEIETSRLALESVIRTSVLPLSRSELVGRALAFFGGLDPTAFGLRIAGHELHLDVVPAAGPCLCTRRRVRTQVPCGACHGSLMIPTVIPPKDRVHTEAEVRARGNGTNGKGPLTDAHGRPLS